jgi:hypothetical protein
MRTKITKSEKQNYKKSKNKKYKNPGTKVTKI